MTKSVGQWKLPQPTDIKENNEWVPIPRISRTVPYGYELDPNDSFILLPIAIELDMLEKAKKEEVSYSPIVTKAYSKKWSKEELVSWVKENYDGVECIEMNNKQIAFSINGNRVPTEGFLTVS